MSKKIVLIDDDKAGHEFYILELEVSFPGYDVKFYQYPQHFDSDNIYNETAIVVLDIMFVGDGEIEGGFNLGLEWYETFKNLHSSIPVIILTNVPSNSTDEFMESIYNNDILIEKPSTTPRELARKVEQLIR